MIAGYRLGAALAAASLVMTLAAVTTAAPPGTISSIRVEMFADPPTVPPAGGTVVLRVAVSNIGTATFQLVTPDDGIAGCVLAGPTGDQVTGSGKGKLEPAEAWFWTCAVDGVMPGTQYTVTVVACLNNGACGSRGDASGSAFVTVRQGTGPSPSPVPPTAAP